MKRLILIFCLGLIACTARGESTSTVRLRITWGGEAEKWYGEMVANTGVIRELLPLGVDTEFPGGAWIVNGTVQVRQAVEKSFNGIDITLPYREDGFLQFRFAAGENFRDLPWQKVPLKQVLKEGTVLPLETTGKKCHISIRRVPGDGLRIHLERPVLVYAPGEKFRCTVVPTHLPVPANTKGELHIQLFRGRETFEIHHDRKNNLALGSPIPVPMDLSLPQEEGVYDLVLTLKTNRLGNKVMEPLSRPLTTGPLAGTKLDPMQTLLERRVQLIVIAPENRVLGASSGDWESRLVVEIDPTQACWWDSLQQSSFQFMRWKRTHSESIGSGDWKTSTLPIGPVAELPHKGGRVGKTLSGKEDEGKNVSWEAYPLTVEKTGFPHILEVEYPEGIEQSLGISILEPNAAGAIIPIGLDSGVNVPPDYLRRLGKNTARWQKHRILFWPKSKTPVVLLTNRHPENSAFYGKIRILQVGNKLPPQFTREEKERLAGNRLIATMFTKPIFPECFSATEMSGDSVDFSMDDWITFYDATCRLLEYLNHVGYGGVMMNVYADGSSIYPSSLLNPTPRYDSGIFFPTAQDEVRKDVLEMMLRLFHRERLTLIPGMDFSSPIPELEVAARFPGAQELPQERIPPGFLRWHDLKGEEMTQTLPHLRQGAPYYNILHPYVQEVVLRSMAEVVERYSHHPSFGGIALQLHANSFLVLPSPQWGMDAYTIEQFARETKHPLPASYEERVRYLSAQGASAWMAWRASRMTLFYRRAAGLLAHVPHAQLYLVGTDLLTAEDHPELTPHLSRSTTAEEVLLRCGLDIEALRKIPKLAFPRPQRITPNLPLPRNMVDLQWLQTPGTFRAFQSQTTPGSVFFHPAQTLRLSDFDAQSPFLPTYTWLCTTFSQAGDANRRRFAESLAMMEAGVILDGGWMPALGQEDAIRETIRILRQLPNGRFSSAMMTSMNDRRSQPVIFRSLSQKGNNYAYAVNLTPFPIEGRVRLQSSVAGQLPPQVVRLVNGESTSLGQDEEGMYWHVTLAPYQIEAIYFAGTPILLCDPVAFFSGDIRTAFQEQYQLLQQKLQGLRHPTLYMGLENASFENVSTSESVIPGWQVNLLSPSGLKPAESAREKAVVRLDHQESHSGNTSLYLASQGDSLRVWSHPFVSSPTGRLSVAVWMKTRSTVAPPLRFLLEGKCNGKKFYRIADLTHSPQKITSQWTPLTINVNDLPLDETLELRIGFELAGSGEIWMDNLQLSDMNFTSEEQKQLAEIFSTFGTRIQKGDIVPCVSILESYWMRFLQANVGTSAMPTLVASHTEPAPAHSPPPTTPPPTPPLVSEKSLPQLPPPPQETSPEKKKSYLQKMKDWLPW
ncbi:MAG: family 10 glycosylhydrolase [Planctomycetia bacterium]|nr:family 10 glycosylhydrolase [Planctomycetia bacterium]